MMTLLRLHLKSTIKNRLNHDIDPYGKIDFIKNRNIAINQNEKLTSNIFKIL